MSIKQKLKNWLDSRWDYEIHCDVFEGLNQEEINKIAKKYNIDVSISRVEICKELAKILQAKKEDYERTLQENLCSNTMDPISGTDIQDIDPRELLTISQNGQQYCFEIDGIYKNIFVNNNPKNPYTNVPFDEEALKFIEKEYEKYKVLKGKKFDKYIYSSETNLSALVNQLSNYLPYTIGIDRFLSADRHSINSFLNVLLDFYDVVIPSGWGIFPENVGIPVENDTRLREYKIKIVQELIRWIVNNDYMPIREAWLDTFQESQFEEGLESQLFSAIENNDIDEIKILIERGVNINHRNSIGYTPIMNAILNRDLDTIRFLIENGADLSIENYDEYSALVIAAQTQNKHIIELVLDNIEYIDDRNLGDIIYNILIMDDPDLLQNLLSKDIDINTIIDEQRNTPLNIAINNNLKLDIIDILLKEGASVDVKNTEGTTPLLAAIRKNKYPVKLLEMMVNLSDNVEVINDYGETPLSLAKFYNYPSVVNLIKEKITFQDTEP